MEILGINTSKQKEGIETITCKTKGELNRCKSEIESMGTNLSEKDFHDFFEGDIKQKNIGNCWLVSAIISLKNSKEFKEIIRKSVKRNGDIFEITLPLGAPKGVGKVFLVSKEDLAPQISIHGEELLSLEGAFGLQALVIAYGKFSTGIDQFDIQDLAGGNYGSEFNTLLHNFKGYSRVHNVYKTGETNDILFQNELTRALVDFTDTALMTIVLPAGENIQDVLDFRKGSDILKRGHAFSVKSVQKTSTGRINSITLINPWDSSKTFTVTLRKVSTLSLGYSLASKQDKDGLTEERKVEISGRKGKGMENVSEKEYTATTRLRKSDFSTNYFLGEIFRNPPILRRVKNIYRVSNESGSCILGSGFSEGISRKTVLGRNEVKEEKWEAYVREIAKEQLIPDKEFPKFRAEFLERMWKFKSKELDYVIRSGTQILNFGKENPFFNSSNPGNSDQYILHPTVFCSFINKMRDSDYLSGAGDTAILNPFYIDNVGNLSFSEWRISDYLLNTNQASNTLIKDWNGFGLFSITKKQKQLIADFLNRLYSTGGK